MAAPSNSARPPAREAAVWPEGAPPAAPAPDSALGETSNTLPGGGCEEPPPTPGPAEEHLPPPSPEEGGSQGRARRLYMRWQEQCYPVGGWKGVALTALALEGGWRLLQWIGSHRQGRKRSPAAPASAMKPQPASSSAPEEGAKEGERQGRQGPGGERGGRDGVQQNDLLLLVRGARALCGSAEEVEALVALAEGLILCGAAEGDHRAKGKKGAGADDGEDEFDALVDALSGLAGALSREGQPGHGRALAKAAVELDSGRGGGRAGGRARGRLEELQPKGVAGTAGSSS